MESGVIAHTGRQRLKQVLGVCATARVEVDVAIEDEACITGNCHQTAIDLSALHVVFIQILVVVGVEATLGDLVEADNIALSNQSWPWWICVRDEQFRYGDLSTGEQCAIGAKLGE